VLGSSDRQDVVLTAALETFVRYGYRKTSMEDVASAARISRPGLYFLFQSKQELFAAAVTRGLEQDLSAAARALEDEDHTLHDRLLEAFDAWTGRYIGGRRRAQCGRRNPPRRPGNGSPGGPAPVPRARHQRRCAHQGCAGPSDIRGDRPHAHQHSHRTQAPDDLTRSLPRGPVHRHRPAPAMTGPHRLGGSPEAVPLTDYHLVKIRRRVQGVSGHKALLEPRQVPL